MSNPSQQQKQGASSGSKSKLPPWTKSTGWELLRACLRDGRIPLDYEHNEESIRRIHQMRPEFAERPFPRFLKYFDTQLVAIRKEKMKEALVSWHKSKAKELLTHDLLNRRFPMEPTIDDTEQIFQSRPEYKLYEKYFKENLKKLRAAISKRKMYAAIDNEALTHDRRIHPKATHNVNGRPRWEGSDGERLLKEAIDQGIVDKPGFKPKSLYESRDEWCKVFTLKEFRDHIYQEQRTRKFLRFWVDFKGKKPSVMDELE